MDTDACPVRHLLDDAAFGGLGATVDAASVAHLEPAFELAESAIELFDLTDAEVDAVAGIGLRESGFHAIVGVALPPAQEGEDGDGGSAPELSGDLWGNLTRRVAAFRESGAYAALLERRWQIAAGIGICAAAIGIPAAYSAGWDSALQQFSPTVEEAADPGSQPAPGPAEEPPAEQGASWEADRIPAEEVQPITVYPAVEPASELARLASVDVAPGTSRVLDVPMVNQLDASDGGRSLRAGCEVASLSMLLRHAGLDVSKEQLQDAMPTVPLVGEDGLHGNPNWAFVGNMGGDASGAGYSVYHAPVAELAQRYTLNRALKVVDLTGQSFTTMLKEVADGNPCWVITTTSMTPEMRMEEWQTAEGPITVNWALHSVVVTGYDDESVFINDPYRYDANTPCHRDDFERAWKLMGSQAVAIVPAE